MARLFCACACVGAFGMLMALRTGAQTAPATVPASAPAAQSAPALADVPGEEARFKSVTLIRNLFKEDYARRAPADRSTLAKRLLQEAGTTRDDLAARYVLLEEAADVACSAGDAETAVNALNEMGRLFRVDALDLKCRAMLRTQPAAQTPSTGEALANACLALMQQAAAADRFDAGAQMAGIAEAAANKTKKVAFVSGIQQSLADFRALADEFVRVQQAREKLRTNPEDDALNLVVGRFYCLMKGQWDRGLNYLAAGSDARLRDLAHLDLTTTADPLRRKQMGDAWWAWAQTASECDRKQAQQHAADLYRSARSDLAGLTLDEVNRRIRLAEAPAGAQTQPQGGVNALLLIDVVKDAVEGAWKLTDGVLTCDAATHARLQLPVRAAEEYDLHITFTRTEGTGPVVLLLTGRGTAFGFALDVKGHEARFEEVNHKVAADNPTRVDCTLENGHRYAVVIQMRKEGVTALLDGKILSHWKTDYKDLTRYDMWKLNDPKSLGLGVGKSVVRFEKVEVTDVTGESRRVR